MTFTKEDMDRAYKAGREAGLHEARELADTAAASLREALYKAAPLCKWCLNPESHPRHDFITPGNHASAKHNFEVAR